MIPIDKVKSINDAPNIIMRNGDRWTHGAKKGGMNFKGLEFLSSSIPLEIYNKAKMFGGKDFWDKTVDGVDGYWEQNFARRRKDIVDWLDKEEKKLHAKIANSHMVK